MAKLLSAIVMALFVATAVGTAVSTNYMSFSEYHQSFSRDYSPDSEEYTHRQALFQERAQKIHEQNAKPGAKWQAVFNKFTDRTPQELAMLRGRRGFGGSQQAAAAPSLSLLDTGKSLAESVEWRSNLTGLKSMDQAGCGSCWAFATVQMLRSYWEIKFGEQKLFSPQQLVDCTPNPRSCGGTGGCQGATVELAMRYIVDNGGLMNLETIHQNEYTGQDGTCKSGMEASEQLRTELLGDTGDTVLSQKSGSQGPVTSLPGSVSITFAQTRSIQQHIGIDSGNGQDLSKGQISWQTLPSNKAADLRQAVMLGPVAISVAAGQWFSYGGGVFDGCSTDNQASLTIDHAVLLTGYGAHEDGDKYWTILNSWGENWGDGGFIHIKRESTDEADDAFCGWDLKPEDGIECKPYPEKVRVCGHCGLTYDSVSVSPVSPAALLSTPSLRGGIF